MGNLNMILNILSVVAVIGSAYIILGSKVKTENLKDLKDRVELLEKERETSKEQHIENQKAISNLEGQLATYKQIPLVSIADSLKEIGTSNRLILARLDKSADDGAGVLVHTDPGQPLDVKTTRSK